MSKPDLISGTRVLSAYGEQHPPQITILVWPRHVINAIAMRKLGGQQLEWSTTQAARMGILEVGTEDLESHIIFTSLSQTGCKVGGEGHHPSVAG